MYFEQSIHFVKKAIPTQKNEQGTFLQFVDPTERAGQCEQARD